MAPFKSICIIALATILVVAAGVTAHHVYETHLSSGYAPIFKAAMMGTYDERPAYIHKARLAVRTDKNQEVEAKLEKMQADATEENTASSCADFEVEAQTRQRKLKQGHRAFDIGQGSFASVRAADKESVKADNTEMTCDAADGDAMMDAAYQLWIELRTTAGLPLN
jgi:hypothetical protein